MIDIGIIGAMVPEVEGIISKMENKREEGFGGISFTLGEIFGKRVVIARCGIGKVFAALCAQTMILKYSPSLIVNTGVGGAVAADLKTGDVVVAQSLCQHDMDTSAIGDPKGLVSGINIIYFEADKRASEILLSKAKEMGLSARAGRIATGDRFIASKEDKEIIREEFSADACEFVNKVPFAVVRAISDSADGEATMDYPTFLPIAAKNSTEMTLALVREY